MVDKPWEEGVSKWLEKHNVLLFHLFSCKNSRLFYLLSKISGTFEQQNPSEVLVKTPCN
jgi:hypothetical protein